MLSLEPNLLVNLKLLQIFILLVTSLKMILNLLQKEIDSHNNVA